MSQVISIRQVQHYLYCPHRWGLIEIGRIWEENYFVTKSQLMHERVHGQNNDYSIRGKKVWTSVSVYNDLPEYNLYGVTDCIEETLNPKSSNELRFCIVEYKPTAPKNKPFNFENAMQGFAQKICVDYLFKTNCDAVIYYADKKKRQSLNFAETYDEYNNKLKELLINMRECMTNGTIPQIVKGQKCSGCSFKDVCMPKKHKAVKVKDRINLLD
ncbi:MAG: CRISPR-associated protein Cas4 [Bdellovibrionota bacterium]